MSNADLLVGNRDFLLLTARLGPTAAAVGDLTVEVRAYEPDGTLLDLPLAATVLAAAALAGGVVRTVVKYEVRGLAQVQVRAKNTNAGALPATLSYALDDD